MNPTPSKIEPVVYLLTGLLIFFTLATFLAEWWFRTDGAFFQSISNMLSMIAGALMMKIKVDLDHPRPPMGVQIAQSTPTTNTTVTALESGQTQSAQTQEIKQ
jgi:hypothetical protein